MKRNKIYRSLIVFIVSFAFVGQVMAAPILADNLLDAPGVDIKDLIAASTDPSRSILTGNTITFTDPATGDPVDPVTIEADVNMSFDFAIPEDIRLQLQEGDFYEIQLPDEIKIVGTVPNIELRDGDGNLYGNVIINTNGTIQIEFTDYVTQMNEISGSFAFAGKLNEEFLEGPGQIEIILPGETQFPPTVVDVKPVGGSAIDKDGFFDREVNPNSVTWHVDVNKTLDTLTNATVTETMPPELIIDEVKVYQVRFDFDGELISGSDVELTSATDYNVDVDGNVTFLISPITDAYRIVYTTTIDEAAKPEVGGPISLLNKAVLNADEVTDLEATSTITSSYNEPLSKTGDNYDPVTKIATWTIEYNYQERPITQGAAWIKDVFGNENMQLSGVVQVQEVSFDVDGNEELGLILTEGTEYILSNELDGFEIQFDSNITKAYKVTYKTYFDGIIDASTNFGNTVEDFFGHGDGGTVHVPQVALIKNVSNVDHNTRTASWNINVNGSRERMINWQLHDVVDSKLSIEGTSIKVQDLVTGQYLSKGTGLTDEYTVTVANGEKSFDIVFINAYTDTNHNFRITYDTIYSSSEDREDTTYLNTANAQWTDSNGNPHTNTDDATFTVSPSEANNGLKSGSYNAQTKQITWTIAANYNEMQVIDGELTDTLSDNQTYVPESLRIFNYTVDVNGTIIKGTQFTPQQIADYFEVEEPSTANTQTLKIVVPGTTYARYLFEFETTLEGKVIEESSKYTNNAIFKDGVHEDMILTGTVSVANGGEMALKSGTQDNEGYAAWNVTLNPAQSTMRNVVVTDTPSDNQKVQTDSVVVYGTTVAPNGTITKDTSVVLQKDVDYTVAYELDTVSGKWQLKIAFLNEINKAYIIEYKSLIVVETGATSVTATNAVKITGDGIELVNDDANGSVPIDINKGSGVAQGTRGSMLVHKESDDGLDLVGTKFQLYDSLGRMIGGVRTTDANGMIDFTGLLYGTYTLKEVEATLGYSISPELHDGIAIEVNALTTGGLIQDVVNEPSKVLILKEDETATRLEGAEFELYYDDGGTWERTRSAETFVTIADGELLIETLPVGKYQLIEVKAPDGYVINKTPIEFEVVADADGFIEPITLEPFINYKGSADLTKVNETNEVLEGAEFTLLDKDKVELETELKTDENGKIEIGELSPGTYYFVETKAPNGYVLNSEPVEFVIKMEALDRPVVEHTKKLNRKPIIPTVEEPKGEIPTGDTTNKNILLGFLMMSAAGLGFVFYRRKQTK